MSQTEITEIYADDTQSEEITRLIRGLGSHNRALRRACRKQLMRMGPEANEQLATTLREFGQNRKPKTRIGIYIEILLVGFYICLVPHLLVPTTWILLFAIAPLLLIAMGLCSSTIGEINCILLLAETDDKRAVGPLAIALESRDAWMISGARIRAVQSLTRLLPELTEADSELVRQPELECLQRALSHAGQYDADFTKAIIHALRMVGNSGSIRPLVRLVENRYFVGKNNELEMLARSAIQEITAREERLRAPDVLVRAGSEEVRSEILLRSNSTVREDPTQLVRAVTGTGDE